MTEKQKTTGDTKSALKVLEVLNVLLRNFAYGYSPTELAKETGFGASDITRYVNTLETAGFAERIQETGRIRPSHRHAQFAVQILKSLEHAEQRLTETKKRLFMGDEAAVNRNMKRLTGVENNV
jgi:DNA-binding IclR family transcriptional regulator